MNKCQFSFLILLSLNAFSCASKSNNIYIIQNPRKDYEITNGLIKVYVPIEIIELNVKNETFNYGDNNEFSSPCFDISFKTPLGTNSVSLPSNDIYTYANYNYCDGQDFIDACNSKKEVFAIYLSKHYGYSIARGVYSNSVPYGGVSELSLDDKLIGLSYLLGDQEL